MGYTWPRNRIKKSHLSPKSHSSAPSERRDILSNYLVSYHGARHSENEKDDAGTGIQQDAEDVQANLDIRKEVTDALLSLFGDQPECSSKEAVREFLDSSTSQDDQAILRRLFHWADTRVRKVTEGNPVVTVSASTAGELVTNLENFTTHSEDEKRKARNLPYTTGLSCEISFRRSSHTPWYSVP